MLNPKEGITNKKAVNKIIKNSCTGHVKYVIFLNKNGAFRKGANMRTYDEGLLIQLSDYIYEEQKEHAKSPGYRKIMKRFPRQFSSLSKVKRYVDILESKRVIQREPDGKIAIDERFTAEVVNVPLVGAAACGQPILAIQDIEDTYALPANLFGSGDLVMVRVKGTSMIDIGIDDGDLVVVRKQRTAEYGQNILAMIEGEATIKEYRPEKERVVLHPRNKNMKDIIVKDCEVFGVVVGNIKKF